MAPPIIPPSSTPSSHPRALFLEPLTPSSFADFGTAISPPFPPSVRKPPNTVPPPLHSPHQPPAVLANQNSALKTSPISQFTNNYHLSPTNRSSTPQMSMFSCFPRNLSGIGIDSSTG